MGMHRDMNKKRPAHIKFNYKRHREKLKRKLARHPRPIGEIPDADIMPPGQLLKLRTNPNANIELSGKRKRKIMKQLRRELKEKAGMEVAVAPAATIAKAAAVADVATASRPGGSGTVKKKRAAAAKKRRAVAMEIDK